MSKYMRCILLTLFVLVLLGTLCCCRNEQNDNAGVKNIKPEGQVYLYITPNFSGDVLSKNEDILINISCGCNGLLEQIPDGAKARLKITSDDVAISQSEIVFEDFPDKKYFKESNPVYEYVLSAKDMISNIGGIKFEIQLLSETDEVIEFANKNLYFAYKGEQLYITCASIEYALNYLSKDQDIYYDSKQGFDFFTTCFWYNDDEELLYFVSTEEDIEIKRYICEEKDNGLSVKNENETQIFFIEYDEGNKMKIDDKLYYQIDEELFGY